MIQQPDWKIILQQEDRILHNSDRKYRYHCNSLESMSEELVYQQRRSFSEEIIQICAQDFTDTVENEALASALRRLTVRQKEIIRLHYWEGYALKEIAAQLHCAPNTVSQLLSRARTHLKQHLIK